MPLPFKKQFSDDFGDETILECADEIVTNPKIPWRQITGQDHILCRPFKYIAEGEVEGKKIRVVFEPEERGILAVYPTD
jgi:hypothetical protein